MKHTYLWYENGDITMVFQFFLLPGFWYLTLAGCPDGWTAMSSSSSCYIYISDEKTMKNAVKYCYEEFKAVVAMPKTQAENDFLDGLRSSYDDPFIGLTDRRSENNWEFLDGDPLQVSAYNSSPWESDPSYDRSENCVQMKGSGKWRTRDCSNTESFWCQKDFNISDSCTDKGWFKEPYQDICYKDFGSGNYQAAINQCHDSGYDILMPKNTKQHLFVQWFIEIYVQNDVWIGLTDKSYEGYFKWDAGYDTDFRAFNSGQPNDLDGDQDCVKYDDLFGEFEWNDWDCTSSYATIVCQAQEFQFTSDISTVTGAETTVITEEMTTPVADISSTEMTNSVTDITSDISSMETTNLVTDITSNVLSTEITNSITGMTSDISSTEIPIGYCVCVCPEENNSTFVLSAALEKLKKELKVNVQVLSSTIRAKTCADDSRPSSRNIGIMGIFIMLTVIGFIFIPDFMSFYKYIAKLKFWNMFV